MCSKIGKKDSLLKVECSIRAQKSMTLGLTSTKFVYMFFRV